MKEEWLLNGAVVPVTCETVTALVAEIHRLIGVVGGMALAQPPQHTWVGLTDEEIWETTSRIGTSDSDVNPYAKLADARAIEAKLKEKNT